MRSILVMLCFSLSLFGDDYTLKLYEEILGALSKKYHIVVYSDAQNSQILKKSDKFRVVHFCNEDVDFLVGSHFGRLSALCEKRPLFTTTHRAYKKYKNAFGAFYWTKGRPQIHFKKDVLKQFKLKLPQNLKRFEDE